MKLFLIAALVLLGVALLGIGIVYIVEPAKHLPSIFPGSSHSHKHGVKHGVVALGFALLAGIAAVLVVRRSHLNARPS